MMDIRDDSQYYPDILFADYQQAQPACRLRSHLLWQMHGEKERLRAAGIPTRDVFLAPGLTCLVDSGPPAASQLLYLPALHDQAVPLRLGRSGPGDDLRA